MTRSDRLVLAATVALIVGVVVALCVVDTAAAQLFFAWPTGGVWSNLLASLLLGGPAVLTILRRLEHHHAAMRALTERHHAEVLAQMGAHQ